MGCQSRSRNYFVARHHGEKWFFSHGIMQASIIPTRFSPLCKYSSELMLGGVVAKRDALFSTESLWDTQVGHQGVGENQKNKGMRLSSHSTLQLQGYQTRPGGCRILGLDERTGRWEATLQKN